MATSVWSYDDYRVCASGATGSIQGSNEGKIQQLRKCSRELLALGFIPTGGIAVEATEYYTVFYQAFYKQGYPGE